MINVSSIEKTDHRKEEIKRLSFKVAEIELLLTALTILYVEISGLSIQDNINILISLCAFSLFILVFHYSGLQKIVSKWKLTIDTWAMIVFISFILWNTGKIGSPLLALYIFPIITASSMLGEGVAFLEMGLISAIFLLLSFTPSMLTTLTPEQLSGPLIQMFPLWLTGYVTIKLAKENDFVKSKIEELSYTDYLTGLYTMRIFMLLMEKELVRSSRFNYNFSLLIIDADNLKWVNDTYGHLAGDEMIKLFGETIKKNMRTTDIIARYGGDEFIVLLPETNVRNAYIAAERVRKVIEKSSYPVKGVTIQMTTSIGIASFPDNGTQIEELINKADKALLKGKKDGKNRGLIYADNFDADTEECTTPSGEETTMLQFSHLKNHSQA
jgi:diguanylate cyclase (GGDEF)-like protein